MGFNYHACLASLLVSVDRVLVLNPGSHYPACPSPWGHSSLRLVCHPKAFGVASSEQFPRVAEDLQALLIAKPAFNVKKDLG
jgi:hypothetical protein